MAHNKPRARISADTLRQLKIKCNYECICCGMREGEGMKLVPDHIRSLAQGGSDDISNLQLLCWNCNNIKSSLTLDFRDPDWYAHSEQWSVAEREMRWHLADLGRNIALHPDFPLPENTLLYLQLWDCLDYSEAQLKSALRKAMSLGYRFPHSLPVADDILHGKAIAPSTRRYYHSAELLAWQAARQPSPRPPRRIITRLKGIVPLRTRVGYRQGELVPRWGTAPTRWVERASQRGVERRQSNLGVARVVRVHRAKLPPWVLPELKEKYNYRCLCCGAREADGASLVPDHVKPRIYGGSDEMSNLQLLCSRCNAIKSDQELDFRATAWYYDNDDWSSAESTVRMYMLTQERSAAFHRNYVLPTQVRHLIELWECRDYFFDAMIDAIDQAEELGYLYPQVIEVANAILEGEAPVVNHKASVKSSSQRKRKEGTAASEAPQKGEPALPRPPRRVTTRLKRIAQPRKRVGKPNDKRS